MEVIELSNKHLSRRAQLWDANLSDLPDELREEVVQEIEQQEREAVIHNEDT